MMRCGLLQDILQGKTSGKRRFGRRSFVKKLDYIELWKTKLGHREGWKMPS